MVVRSDTFTPVCVEPRSAELLPPRHEARGLAEWDGGTLITDRLVLRAMKPEDRGAFVEAVSGTPDLCSRLPVRREGESDLAMFERHLCWGVEGDRSGNAWRRLAVLRADPSRIVGMFNLNGIQRGLTSEADANWWLTGASRGRGLAIEALRGIVSAATADFPQGLGLARIHAGIMPTNVDSVMLARRAGFERVAGQQSYLKIAGKWERHDCYVFSA
jgi:RimJ/RimL family protein N-acetyltransferase